MNYGWHINVNGKNEGPFGEEEVLAKFKTGAISPATFVWREGMAGWVPLAASGIRLPSSQPAGSVNTPPGIHSGYYGGPGNDRFGGFGIRLLASMVDGVVLYLCNLVAIGITAVVSAAFSGTFLGPLFMGFGTLAMIFGIPLWYHCILQTKMEGTIGKRALGLRLVREDFGPISQRQALVRFGMFIVSYIPLGAGLIAVIFSEKKQGWHDTYAKTFVVRKEYLEMVRGTTPTVRDERKAA